jgi:hypothetical protein
LSFSAVDAISPAIEHTKRQLLQPFRLGQWTRLAFVGLLAGELSSGGFNTPNQVYKLPHHPGAEHLLSPGVAIPDLAVLAPLVVVLILAAFVLGLVLMYISSVMRFILFDSIVAKECHIRRGWRERQQPGSRYFVWKIVFGLVCSGVLILIVGVPAAFGFAAGWFTDFKEHVAGLVLTGIAVFFALALFVIAILLIYVLTKDFVIPQMALENIGVMEGWRRLWAMMKAEKAGYAGYIGMKILLAIVVGILVGIVAFILALIILIPIAAAAAAAVLAGKAAGLGWTVSTITLAILEGCALLTVFLYVMALITVPAIVFFPAYSIYFFAARYPALGAVLYGGVPGLAPPGTAPASLTPPPLPV